MLIVFAVFILLLVMFMVAVCLKILAELKHLETLTKSTQLHREEEDKKVQQFRNMMEYSGEHTKEE